MNRAEVALKRPFKLSQLKWRKGQGGSGDLVYITARDAQDRLDQVFGIDGWEVRYEWMGNRTVCYLSCRFGDKFITKADGSEDTNIEGAKGGISTAFKRACSAFGLARYLYHPSAFNSSREPASWATPEGYDALMASREGMETEQWKKEYDNALQN